MSKNLKNDTRLLFGTDVAPAHSQALTSAGGTVTSRTFEHNSENPGVLRVSINNTDAVTTTAKWAVERINPHDDDELGWGPEGNENDSNITTIGAAGEWVWEWNARGRFRLTVTEPTGNAATIYADWTAGV